MHIRVATSNNRIAARAAKAAVYLMMASCVFASAYAADDVDAHAWLERMTRALATRNYDGRFLRLGNGHAENMRIVHRVADGVVTERLVSLDGSGREVIRTADEVMCY